MSRDQMSGRGHARWQILAGILSLAVWGGIQFGVAPHTGWIHVLLAGGVLLIVRGIAAD